MWPKVLLLLQEPPIVTVGHRRTRTKDKAALRWAALPAVALPAVGPAGPGRTRRGQISNSHGKVAKGKNILAVLGC